MLVKEFLFGQSKFSAFNNNHFVILSVITGLLVTYYSLYYAGRFYAANYEAVIKYAICQIGPNPPAVENCNAGQSDCLLLAVICTLFLVVNFTIHIVSVLIFMLFIPISFVIAIISFFYERVLSYLFFSYMFYIALPSIHTQYLRFHGEKTSQQMEDTYRAE